MRMLIVNPIAGCGYALKVMEQVQSVLTARNLPFRVMRTEYPGYAAKLAREAVEMGCEAVYVIGGDGTFSEAARGLAGSGIPIGLIPAGTGNDFVKTLGTPKEPMAALDFILSHEPRPCDAIDLNGQLFLNVAGAGFDVTVLENVADFGASAPTKIHRFNVIKLLLLRINENKIESIDEICHSRISFLHTM